MNSRQVTDLNSRRPRNQRLTQDMLNILREWNEDLLDQPTPIWINGRPNIRLVGSDHKAESQYFYDEMLLKELESKRPTLKGLFRLRKPENHDSVRPEIKQLGGSLIELADYLRGPSQPHGPSSA